MIGQTKTCIKGPWKGYDGTILSINDTHARFELSAKAKTVNIRIEDLNTIINSKNRSNAGVSVPAYGLYLTEVKYPKEVFNV